MLYNLVRLLAALVLTVLVQLLRFTMPNLNRTDSDISLPKLDGSIADIFA